MQMTDIQRHELRHCVERKPAQVLFATACGPLLYGFPHQNRYFDLRSVHVDQGDALPRRGAMQETREWRESQGGSQVEWISHEVGKFVRLLQVNNGSAYEQLLSPHVVLETAALAELRELARQMVSQQLFLHYRGFFHSQLKFFYHQREKHARHLLYLYRVGLTGLHLMETGELVADLPMLASYHERATVMQLLREIESHGEVRNFKPFVREVEALADRLEQAPNRKRLPEQVPHRQEAEAWLERTRQPFGSPRA